MYKMETSEILGGGKKKKKLGKICVLRDEVGYLRAS